MIRRGLHGRRSRAILLTVLLIAPVSCAETAEPLSDPQLPYAQGVALYEAGGEANLRQAIDLFSRAVALDSMFAPGWAALARAYASIGGNYNILPPEESWPPARQAAANALRLDDGLADAHLAQAHVLEGADWDWPAAEIAYQRALGIDPDNVEALNSYAWFLNAMGRPDEAAPLAARAAELAPGFADRFLLYLTTGDAAAQLEAANAAIAAAPTNPYGYWVSALIHAWEGEWERAARMLQEQIPLMEGDVVDEVALLGFVYGRMGREDDARGMLERLDEAAAGGRHVSPVLKGWIHAGLGDADGALNWLRMGVDAHAHRAGLGLTGFSALFDPIRDNPGFTELLRSIGLQS